MFGVIVAYLPVNFAGHGSNSKTNKQNNILGGMAI